MKPNIDDIITQEITGEGSIDRLEQAVKLLTNSHIMADRLVSFMTAKVTSRQSALMAIGGKFVVDTNELKTLISWGFEIGRLYGRSELMQELAPPTSPKEDK